MILAGLCILKTTELGAAFYFYRKDLKLNTVRTTTNISNNDGLYSIFLINFWIAYHSKGYKFYLDISGAL